MVKDNIQFVSNKPRSRVALMKTKDWVERVCINRYYQLVLYQRCKGNDELCNKYNDKYTNLLIFCCEYFLIVSFLELP